MISNLIFSYPTYPAVYDPAYPVFTNITFGIDSIRFFYLLFPDRGYVCDWVALRCLSTPSDSAVFIGYEQ
jgi:hypothetical protein